MTEAKKGAGAEQDAKTPPDAGAVKESNHQDRNDTNDPALSGADAVALALKARG